MIDADCIKRLVKIGWFYKPNKAICFSDVRRSCTICIVIYDINRDAAFIVLGPVICFDDRINREVPALFLARVPFVVWSKEQSRFHVSGCVWHDQRF